MSTSTAGRVAQAVFVAAAVGAVSVFASTVKDGEHRRSPAALAQLLNPSYVGDNRTAPDFDLVDREGHHHKLSDYRGRNLVLHFWSRTCAPCVEELQSSLPGFDEIVRDRSDIALLLVTVDANWTAIAPLVPPDFRSPIVFDPQRRVVTGMYGTRLFPETWVIDRNGVIRARFDHTLEWASPIFVDYVSSLR
ncbi:MAG: TlpA disulfide reductase family protein [Deltaproteobacteria bacterium]